MPLPTSITDLSQTASANFPNGAVDSPASLDDVQRAHASFIALLRDGKGMATPVTLPSAATVDIGAQNSLFIEVSGTTTITSFGATYSGERIIRFTGALTLTHNATTLILPGGASIATAAGDALCAVPTQAGTGWAVVFYQRANGQALAGGESAAIQANTYIKATASGTNSYTITPSPAITAYTADQEFLVTFTNANTGAATLQVSGIASPPAIVKQDSTGAYVALVSGDIPASHRSRMRMLSATQVQLVDKKQSYVVPSVSITYTTQQVPFSGALTDGATIDWNADTNGQVVAVTLGGNRTFAAPTNIKQYAMYLLRVSQDGLGSRTATFNAAYKFGTAGAPTLTTTASKVDILSFVGGAGNTLEFLGIRKDAV